MAQEVSSPSQLYSPWLSLSQHFSLQRSLCSSISLPQVKDIVVSHLLAVSKPIASMCCKHAYVSHECATSFCRKLRDDLYPTIGPLSNKWLLHFAWLYSYRMQVLLVNSWRSRAWPCGMPWIRRASSSQRFLCFCGRQRPVQTPPFSTLRQTNWDSSQSSWVKSGSSAQLPALQVWSISSEGFYKLEQTSLQFYRVRGLLLEHWYEIECWCCGLHYRCCPLGSNP